jgi:lipopolysaccharide transport system ATP-binding protein
MTQSVIQVENLSKEYIIGHQTDGGGLRHVIEDLFRNPYAFVRSRASSRQQTREKLSALKDVSFSVHQGDAVAVIGRNGAGKSTLLKILSRITDPTQGRVRIRGRVASLLEVGTGFHQELTGRENIFLNGAILGMGRSEIKRKFDEIVDFADVEKFLDTPVKRYSSGMYTRLAFAVAAHLEPEILIVDEVLAVGDAQFQKKCLGKMGQVAKGGRTVLFVSHNMSAVQSLCTKAIYLESGGLKAAGDVGDIIARYTQESSSFQQFSSPRQISNALKLIRFQVNPSSVSPSEPLRCTIAIRATEDTTITELNLLIHSMQNVRVALLDLRKAGLPVTLERGDEWEVTVAVTSLPLVEGDYSVGLYVHATNFLDNLYNLVNFTVTGRVTNFGYAPYAAMHRGLVELDYEAGAKTSLNGVGTETENYSCTG